MYGKRRLSTSPGSRSSGTSTALASGTQTRSASAPHTVSAPMRSPARNREQPGAELLDDADELVAGRERRLRPAGDIRAGAQLRIGEGDPGGQDRDAHLARPRSRILVLDHLQDLGPAESLNYDTLHGSSSLSRTAPSMP